VSRERFDSIVVGVGGMGSAALFHLARRGGRVLGLERFGIPHELGSSHGVTRIIRLAYYEDPAYVPLLRRAYELWRELQSRAGEQLLHVTGSIDAGPDVFDGSLRSCEEHDLPHEVLTGAELSRRYPAYRLPPETQVLLQPNGGFLLPERCIEAHVREAQALGAVVRSEEPVVGWEPAGGGVRVRTERGLYDADRLVLCAGAWSESVARLPAGLVTAERQVLAWFEPREPDLFQPQRFPVFNLVVPEGRWYGFPEYGVPGFKVGRYHHRGELVDPDAFDREATSEDEALLRAFAELYFPAGAGRAAMLKTCLFENSPDEHFLLDLHPECPQAVVAAGFSGHGFKFCSVVGEIVAELALAGETRHEIDFLRLERFSATR
jgi:sarcosine oxidase